MSRRASVFMRQNPGKSRVRFPDELVFLDSVRENDIENMHHMLRRASLQMDLNAINSVGMTALHQAALDGNFTAVRLLLKHGADVNKLDDDSWTPLHAACAEGHTKIVRYLLKKGADPTIRCNEGKRPIDQCEGDDSATIAVMLSFHSTRDAASANDSLSEDDDK